jgi:alanine-glyoxylate transaminase/serine-glyoxylate transaminase/serine-pyruvate transaminase
MGMTLAAEEGHRLPMLNAITVPAGVDEARVRGRLLTEHGVEIGGGLGDFKGKAWRIGLMGHNSRPNCVFQVLAALEVVLRGAGVKLEPGRGVAAAEIVYAGA